MVIKSLNIVGFGALKNMNINLSEHLNVIYGKNESGKTTISSFIEAMLYGYGSRDAERRRYIPFDSDCSSGSMTIETEKGEATISRRIFSSEKSSGYTLSPPSFDLSFLPEKRETFRKTVYLSEGGALLFGSSEEIVKRLSNMAQSSDERVNSAYACEIISKALKKLTPQKRTRELEQKISLLNREYRAALEEEKNFRGNDERLSLLEARRNKLKETLEKYNRRIEDNLELREKISRLNDLINRKDEYIASLNLPGNTPPAPFKFSLIRLLPYILCAIFLFIMGFADLPALKFLSPLPLLVPAALWLKTKRARAHFLKEGGFESFDAYRRAKDDFSKAENERAALLSEREVLLSKYVSSSLQGDIKAINSQISKCDDEIYSLKASLSTRGRASDVIASELSYYKSRLEKLKEDVLVLRVARDAVSYATERVISDFTPALNKKVAEYVDFIAPKGARRVSLDSSLTPSVSDPLPVDMSSLSYGFSQEVYIAFRLALSEMLYGASLPLIFDDPFLGSDDEREKRLIELFSRLAEKRQIIIFTNRKNNYFNELNCNYIDISGKNDV